MVSHENIDERDGQHSFFLTHRDREIRDRKSIIDYKKTGRSLKVLARVFLEGNSWKVILLNVLSNFSVCLCSL